MNIIVLIEGREAIPVRAIPLLTNWESMPPATLARVLAGDDNFFGFEGLQAHQLQHGVVNPVTAAWWKSFCVKKLKTLSERIELTHEYKDLKANRWQLESLGLLPAGVFVWKDEYVPLHELNWAARQREGLHSAWFINKCDERSKEIDEAEDPSPMQTVAVNRVRADYESWRTLDFSPTIATGTYENSVLEGFEQLLASVHPQAVQTLPAAPALPDDTVDVGTLEAPKWRLTKPRRFQGYAKPLYLLLQTAHNASQRRPTARDVIDTFATSKPNEIAQILPNGFDYYDAKGNTKGATLDAIGESIRRMTP